MEMCLWILNYVKNANEFQNSFLESVPCEHLWRQLEVMGFKTSYTDDTFVFATIYHLYFLSASPLMKECQIFKAFNASKANCRINFCCLCYECVLRLCFRPFGSTTNATSIFLKPKIIHQTCHSSIHCIEYILDDRHIHLELIMSNKRALSPPGVWWLQCETDMGRQKPWNCLAVTCRGQLVWRCSRDCYLPKSHKPWTRTPQMVS